MKYYVLDVNPEPWSVGQLSMGRKNGKTFPIYGRNQQLHAFQEYVKHLLSTFPTEMLTKPVRIHLYFWQYQDEVTRSSGASTRRHEFDVTNMIKATEDALQGILIDNDNHTWEVQGTVVERGRDVSPKIVVGIEEYEGFDPDRLPDHVWLEIQRLEAEHAKESSNEWATDTQGELF